MIIGNLPNLWLAMRGGAEAGPVSFPRHVSVTESLSRKSTGGILPSRPLPVARFGHTKPLAKDSGRHLLGTRLPGHTSVTPGCLQKSAGGTFWHEEALKAHFSHAAPLAEEHGPHLLGTSF